MRDSEDAFAVWEQAWLEAPDGLRARELLRAALYQVQENAGLKTSTQSALRGEAMDLLERGDHAGAEALLLRRLAAAPTDVEARVLFNASQQVQVRMLLATLGGPARRPRLLHALADLAGLPLTQRELSLARAIDGRRTFAELVRGSGLQPLEAIRALAALVEQGAAAADD